MQEGGAGVCGHQSIHDQCAVVDEDDAAAHFERRGVCRVGDKEATTCHENNSGRAARESPQRSCIATDSHHDTLPNPTTHRQAASTAIADSGNNLISEYLPAVDRDVTVDK